MREGRFRITLPSGATVSRFAMRIGDRWQEGEVVEQQAARVAYEDFLHRSQDPALLEAEAGNEFSARVFPIPAAATKEIVISYAQELTRADEPYRLPLRGLPRIGTLAIRAVTRAATGAGKTETRLERRDVTPGSRLRACAQGRRAAGSGLRDDNLVVARVVPLADTTAREAIGELQVLVDTSASRALGLADEAAAVERLLGGAAAGSGDPIGDRRGVRSGRGADLRRPASGAVGVVGKRIAGARRAGRLRSRPRARFAGRDDQARPSGPDASRVLLVTDGVATAGETRRRQAAGARGGARRARRRRLDVRRRRRHPRRRDAVAAGDRGAPADGVVLDGDAAAGDRWRAA